MGCLMLSNAKMESMSWQEVLDEAAADNMEPLAQALYALMHQTMHDMQQPCDEYNLSLEKVWKRFAAKLDSNLTLRI
jgi:hypothetical protein